MNTTRNGKIARLPKLERDMVNRMLQNNLPYPAIVGALDEVGLAEHFFHQCPNTVDIFVANLYEY